MQVVVVFFASGVAKKNGSYYHCFSFWCCFCAKKATIATTITFFCGGVAEKNKKMTIASVTFFNGFAAKEGDGNLPSLFFFFFWSFWFNSKKLKINNEMVVFFYVEGHNG